MIVKPGFGCRQNMMVRPLTIHHYPEAESVYFAYFAPYSYERHQDLLAQAQASGMCQLVDLGNTLDNRDMSFLLIVGEPAAGKKKSG